MPANGRQVTGEWPSIGDKCVMIATSEFAQVDGSLQQSAPVSFIDKSVIGETVCIVQEQSHEWKTL